MSEFGPKYVDEDSEVFQDSMREMPKEFTDAVSGNTLGNDVLEQPSAETVVPFGVKHAKRLADHAAILTSPMLYSSKSTYDAVTKRSDTIHEDR